MFKWMPKLYVHSYVKLNTLKIVFEHIPKHLEVRQKYSAASAILNYLLSVKQRSFVFDI